MSAPPLRVGVVGLGSVGLRHAAALAAHPRARVTALCDRSPERLAAAARAHPGARATADADAVLTAGDVDAVCVATFDDAHFAQALAAIRCGRHAFVEKPLCTTDGQLRELARAARGRSGVAVASNLVLRAAPLFREVRDRRRAGDLGTLFAFDGDYLYGRLAKLTEGWRGRQEGYSVMLGGGVHLVDLMVWLCGERPERVTAAGCGIASAASGFAGADHVAATYTFPSGLVGRISANFGCVHPHQHAVRVYGTAATVLSDDAGARIHTGRDDAPRVRPLPFDPLPAGKSDLLPAFVDAALDGRDPDPGIDHELAVVAACLAADRSLREGGRPVAVDLP